MVKTTELRYLSQFKPMKAEELMMRKLTAFHLFVQEGNTDKVAKRYPDQLNFVLENKDKTYEEVSKALRDEFIKP
jgi:hypothetical protein